MAVGVFKYKPSPSRRGLGEVESVRRTALPHPPAARVPPSPARRGSVVLAPRAGRRIGLLGGSFNPAHAGHRHISLEALRRLRLDEIWWLVSPGNPLKSAASQAPFAKRLKQAAAAADHPRIRTLAIEQTLGTLYTVDTIRQLCRLYPRVAFAWLIGADNFASFHRWRDWRTILRLVPVAVLNRPGYSMQAIAARAGQQFRRYRVAERHAADFINRKPPAWIFLHIPLHPLSATELRAKDANWLITGETGLSSRPEPHVPGYRP